MKAVNSQPDPEKVLDQLRPRLEAGSDVATAALIYALIHIHQDQQRANYPPLMEIVYHHEFSKYVFGRPELLRLVLERYSRKILRDPDAIDVWKTASELYNLLNTKSSESSVIRKALENYVAALRKPRIPGNADEEQVILDVAKLHEILKCLLNSPLAFPVVEQNEFSHTREKIAPLGLIFEWIMDSAGEPRSAFGEGQPRYARLLDLCGSKDQNPQQYPLFMRIVREGWLQRTV